MPCFHRLSIPVLKAGSRRLSWLLLTCLFCMAVPSLATTVTVTTLTVTPGVAVIAGTPLTLQAAVDAGGTPATLGTVTFYDGTRVLAAVQVVGRGLTYPQGTANYKLYLGAGAHTVKAVYGGTSGLTPSASSPVVITVTLAAPAPTSTTIAAASGPGNYQLTGRVATASSIASTGPVSFLDQSNSNFLVGSAPLSAATQTNTWQNPATYATASSVFGVILADLNGDGVPDVVTTNYGGTTISVLLGNGDGTFQPHVDYPVGPLSFGLAAGDLNGDGIPDIVVASGATNTVTVFLGNGDGTLQAGQVYATGGVSEYVVLADFNHDGILDLATCSSSVGSVSVLLGNGDGTFAAQQTFGTSKFPSGLAVGDFNHDGNFDLVVANNQANTVSVFLGRGDGTFDTPTDYPTGTGPSSLAVVDLNADGNPDLVVCNSVGVTLSVLLGNADGTFQPKVDYSGFSSPWALVAVDVNGDGIPDVVATSPGNQAVEVFLGQGDGTLLAPQITATGATNYLLAVGDLNGDGVLDLVVPYISKSAVAVALGFISETAILTGVSVPGGGTHNIIASYAGDTSSYPSTSASISLTGSPFATTEALGASPTTGPPGQTFILSASLSPSSSSGYTAGGTVTFFDSGVAIGAPVPVASGSATLSSNTFTSGAHSITASYSGDVNFTASNSSPTVVTVTAAQTITFPALSPVTYGVAPFALSATASSGLTVTFSVISEFATVSGATLTVLGAGSVVLQADQAGDAMHAPAVPVQRTLTVNQASSTVALVASAAMVDLNTRVTFTATVASGKLPAPTGTVVFFDGSTQLAPVPVNALGVASYSTTSLAAGIHSITATYGGDSNFIGSTSSPTVVTVTPTQTITFPALTPVMYGVAPQTLNATASSGLTVTFSLVSGQARLVGTTLTILAAGSIVLQADQAGDSTYQPAAPVQRTLIVNQAASAIALITSEATVPVNTSITFTANVAPQNLRMPTGNVSFFDGSTQIASVAVGATGVATYSTAALTVGPHSIVARYSGDANFLPSFSAAVSETVLGPGYSITANPAAITIKLGQIATSTLTITPVGGFKGQISLACGRTPQIASCSLAPTTVVLPGDDVPHTVQFTLTTSVVNSSPGAPEGVSRGGPAVYGAVLAMMSPFGLVVFVSVARRRKLQARFRRLCAVRALTLAVLLGSLLVGSLGCGTGHTAPFGIWNIEMTATAAAGGTPQKVNVTVTITP